MNVYKYVSMLRIYIVCCDGIEKNVGLSKD